MSNAAAGKTAHPSLVFFDIDGTLVTHGDHIPDSALEAIRAMRENGHFAILNTGRPMAMIHPRMLAGPFDGVIASCGTHIVWQGRTMLCELMEERLVSELVALTDARGAEIWLEGPEHVYLKELNPTGRMSEVVRFLSKLPGVMKQRDEEPVRANKVSCLLPEDGSLSPDQPLFAENFDWIDHGPDFCELVPKGHSKATGIRFLLDHLDHPREHTFAFGDSMNDIDMLSFVQVGIAMGGSREQVVQISDHVTDRPEENGIANALRHFGLIR